MSQKLRFGDIIEIKPSRGLAYAQYTHKDPLYGELIRVLPNLFDSRPASFAELARSHELYFVFYPLTAAVSHGTVTVVANEEIPVWARKFPVMRRAGGMARGGKVLNWWIWDGNKKWRVDSLDEEQKNLSIACIWTEPLLADRISEGWLPRNDARSHDHRPACEREQEQPPDRAEHPVDRLDKQEVDSLDMKPTPGDIRTLQELKAAGSDLSLVHVVRHYLYFPTKRKANMAAARLKGWGYEVEVRKGGDGINWLTLAQHRTVPNEAAISEARSQLEELALRLQGEYDGWEVQVRNRSYSPEGAS